MHNYIKYYTIDKPSLKVIQHQLNTDMAELKLIILNCNGRCSSHL